MLMKCLTKLLPIAAVICLGVQSCDKYDNDDKGAGKTPKVYLGHEYVDLGLKVKWATCNLGATTPDEYGDYFAWGDTATYYKAGYAQEHPQAHWKEGKTDGYKWSTYKYCNGSKSTMTKYCNNSAYGNIDSDTTLLPVDDAAHYMWGGNWRMPTHEELKELSDSCDWEWTTQNDVDGWKVTSKKDSSQSIFLPASGYRFNAYFYNLTSGGYYRSSSLNTDLPNEAWILSYNSESRSVDGSSRFYGYSIRPVFK